MKTISAILMIIATCCFSVTAQADFTVGFDDGDPSGFTGNVFFEAGGGNPGGNAHFFVQAFFPSLRTGGQGEPSNPAFLGDFSVFDTVTYGFDVRVDSITDFIGNEIARPFGIMLIDRDIQGPSGPSGVFFETPALNFVDQDEWTHYSVTIDDPTAEDLPPGWIGFGDEDPNTFEPILPPGASFATVLAGVDEFRLTGAVPGFFFNNANFDFRIDNVSVKGVVIPEPSSACCLGITGLLLFTRRRKTPSGRRCP